VGPRSKSARIKSPAVSDVHRETPAGWYVPSVVSFEDQPVTIANGGPGYSERRVVGLYPVLPSDDWPPFAHRTEKADARGALRAFLKLAELSAEEFEHGVRGFILRYGQLVVGPFGKPEEDPDAPAWSPRAHPHSRIVDNAYGGRNFDLGTGEWREPLDSYIHYPALLGATIRTADRAREGRRPLEADRSSFDRFLSENGFGQGTSPYTGAIAPPEFLFGAEWGREDGRPDDNQLEFIWLLILSVVNWWLTARRVCHLLGWRGRAPAIELVGGTWALLGMQLLHAVEQGSEPLCEWCRGEFVYAGRRDDPMYREKRPKASQSAWCKKDECRAKRAARDKRTERTERKRSR
jgi:hypothetical protein